MAQEKTGALLAAAVLGCLGNPQNHFESLSDIECFYTFFHVFIWFY